MTVRLKNLVLLASLISANVVLAQNGSYVGNSKKSKLPPLQQRQIIGTWKMDSLLSGGNICTRSFESIKEKTFEVDSR